MITGKGIATCLLVSCSIVTTWAQEQSTKWQSEFYGEAHALGRYYLSSSEAADYRWQAETRLNLEGEVSYGPRWKGEAAVLGNLNAQHTQRNRLWVNELSAAYHGKGIFLKAGKQSLRWGDLTGFSASDLANRYDYYDVLDTERERLGLWGVETRLYKGSTELRLRAFLPDNRSRIYLEDNRWVALPSLLPNPQISDGMLPAEHRATITEFNDQIPMLGASFSVELGRLQTRLTWQYGNNDLPISEIAPLPSTDLPIGYEVHLRYEPLQVAALNIGTWLGEWNIWSEVAGVFSKRLERQEIVQDNYTFTSLGIDRFWQFENPEQHLRLMMQAIRVWANPDTPYLPTEIDHIFQSSLVLDTQWQMSYRWQCKLRTVAELTAKGYYLEPQVVYQASPKFKMALNASWLGGRNSSFFGHFKQNSRFSLLISRQLP